MVALTGPLNHRNGVQNVKKATSGGCLRAPGNLAAYWTAPQGPAGFQSPLYPDTSQSGGKQAADKKGSNIWLERLIINSTEERGFRVTWFQAPGKSKQWT